MIAIQGYEGSFHQIAARQFFGEDSAVLPCATFGEVVQHTSHNAAVSAGLMAIENSIAGSILPNYTLLNQGHVHIVGEVYVPIRQHLLVYPGVSCSDIREVHSHPMALLQCQEFLTARNWQMVETVDTALSARHLRERQWRHIAVVAGSLAAELFQVEIAVADIHTAVNNYTRFLVLQRTGYSVPDANKASLLFHITHTCGSLAHVLAGIAARGLNICHLQSLPVPATVWQYAFYVDVEFARQEQWCSLLEYLRYATTTFHVYGVYKSGRELQEKTV